MNILIAPDSFKDSLPARRVAEALRSGLQTVMPGAGFRLIPMADGGEGTVEAIVDATGGLMLEHKVKDPLGRDHMARFGIHGDGKTAVIEMAGASGLELLSEKERNPWLTTTYGTGELIRAAIDHGCKRIIIGIGGSATNDAGAGMAMALGVQFLDKSGNSIGFGGGALQQLHRIDMSGADKRLGDVQVLVASDVNNPLTGPQGASQVYGPQKGADKDMVEKLDSNLRHFARVVEENLGKRIEELRGAGAAGGLGGGLIAFTNAELRPGFDIVSEATGLEEAVKQSDLVITGEGKIDFQTWFGKTPMGVATLAKKHGKPVIAVAGTLGDQYETLYDKGFDAIFSIIDKPAGLDYALHNAERLLENTGRSIGGILR